MSSREGELALLVEKTHRDADLIQACEEYYQEHHKDWSPGLAATFRDFLERKKDQYLYELSRVEKLGWLIASGREHRKMDI